MSDRPPNTSIDRLLAQVETSTIASIKGTVSGILAIINDPASSPNDLKDLIQVDPPLVAKILRVANSPYYASSRAISDIDQALIWIGFDALKEIILTQKMSEIFQGGQTVSGYSRLQLWRHSLAVALMAKTIYRREFGAKGNNAYAAGLMHDIGVIVEDQLLHQDFIHLLQETEQQHQPLTTSELHCLGYDHGQVGRQLANQWNFPDELMDGIGFHHSPESAAKENVGFAKTIFIADYLMFENGYGYVDMALPEKELFMQYATDLGLQAYAIESMVTVVLNELKLFEAKGHLV